jgi:hypothetical protein
MNNTIHSASRKVGRIVLFLLGAAAGAVVLTGSTCKALNRAPAVPGIAGPSAGEVWEALCFTVTTTDPEGDSVAVLVDWGDGTPQDWWCFLPSGDPVTRVHSFTATGRFYVRTKARDRLLRESAWSNSLVIDIQTGRGRL